MKSLPPIPSLFPKNNRKTIAYFWIRYWTLFFIFLPWILVRQIGISFSNLLAALWTWNQEVVLLPDTLRLIYMNNFFSLFVSVIFGERFTALHYRDILFDPGPIFSWKKIKRYVAKRSDSIHALVLTHAHEEHIGNVPTVLAELSVPVYATSATLQAIRNPESLSIARKVFIGQPISNDIENMKSLETTVDTPDISLQVIQSPGHCDGHASFYDPKRCILFVGDSFMHTVFTSPNRDVSGADWIRTLKNYCKLDIRTMIGAHGYVYTSDETILRNRFVVRRKDPKQMIQDKLRFMEWARDVVMEGERIGLPYSVIEACLFPWQSWWSWYTWFTDESGRLFSAGEFSRTHFLRSFSSFPENVPFRFPIFANLISRLKKFLTKKKF
ncbi:MBL fold metallo-hydrolase [Leptospira weilii]|uniref:MBL fold metallo-hydrolase n=1 Tax=Leptospira weilii TaxID=28184 RepID=UPI00047523B6|nr:MBL fold metallo-hydrolase [Leptospira weilii]